MKSPTCRALTLVLAAALAARSPAADAPKAPTGPADFPDEAYASLGSSMGQSSHFGELGWTDEQVGAFLDGMRSAFHDRPAQADADTHRLSAELAARVNDIDAGKPGKMTGTYPLKAYTAFGSSIELGGHFGELGWGDEQFESLVEGLRSAFRNKPIEVDDNARKLADMMAKKIADFEAGGQPAAAPPFDQTKLVPFMRDAVKKYHLQMSDSGLGYNIKPSTSGVRPRPGDTVVISCRAVAYDGTTPLPQLSSDHIRSKLDQMFPGFREGLQMMTVGSQAIFVLPPALSFGHSQWPDGVQPGSPLVFEVMLTSVEPAVPAK